MSNFSRSQIAIIILTILTALIHLLLGLSSDGTFRILFILNFLGYGSLLAGRYFIPQLAGQRVLIHWAYMLYAAVTIILYFVFNWPDVWGPMGIIDKVIELVLVILLWQERPTA